MRNLMLKFQENLNKFAGVVAIYDINVLILIHFRKLANIRKFRHRMEKKVIPSKGINCQIKKNILL